jgi:hypothetical protein
MKRYIQLIKSKGLGKELKMRSISDATNISNPTDAGALTNTASMLKMNVTLQLTEDEFRKRVNKKMIDMYQTIMRGIPSLDEDSKKLKEILEKKNEKYLSYLFLVPFNNLIFFFFFFFFFEKVV